MPDHQQLAASDAPSTPVTQHAGCESSSSPRRRHGVGTSIWFVFKAVEIRLRLIAILVGMGLVIGYWDTLTNYWDRWTRPAGDGVVVFRWGKSSIVPCIPALCGTRPIREARSRSARSAACLCRNERRGSCRSFPKESSAECSFLRIGSSWQASRPWRQHSVR